MADKQKGKKNQHVMMDKKKYDPITDNPNPVASANGNTGLMQTNSPGMKKSEKDSYEDIYHPAAKSVKKGK